MSAESIDYPEQFRFSQLLAHYVATRVTGQCNFRCGDWLRFLDIDYLDTLLPALEDLQNLHLDIQQDLILLCQMLVTHETQDSSRITSTRLITAVLERLAHIVKLECARRDGLIFIEQRMSALPDFPLDVHFTRKGRQAASQALPAPPGTQTP